VSALIIALDPGDTTGMAWQYANQDVSSYATHEVPHCSYEVGLRTLLDALSTIVGAAPPVDTTSTMARMVPAGVTVIYETFDFRHDESFRDKIDYTPAEVIGALRCWALDRYNITLVKQNAATGKGFWTDEKVRKLGLWVPGRRHAMDAMRHLLRYQVFVLKDVSKLHRLRPAEGT
jgi:hypothetical protein